MKYIKLTRGFKAIVDDEDYEYLNQFKWCVNIGKKTNYAVRYATINGRYTHILMHREIMNTPKGLDCDHVFHNGLDNRKYIEINGKLVKNLRNCKHSQNMRNYSAYGTSKYLGVSRLGANNRNAGKFLASIKINGKTKHLGYFINEIDAAKAYDYYANLYFGEYSNLNFKDE